MKKGDIVFSRKGDILLLAWKDKCIVQMISMIHNTSIPQQEEEKKLERIFLHQGTHAHTKGIDRADHFLSCCSILKKTMKWGGAVLINCELFSSFRVYSVLNPQTKMKYKQFLLSVVRDWVTDDRLSETRYSPSSGGAKRAPRKDPP